jgi:hypothetical protein
MVQKKLKILLILVIGVICTKPGFSQNFWEPVTNLTGYISTEFNYFSELNGYDYDYGLSVSEAGLLINYRPTENIMLKSVFVYRPGYSFDQMLNEAYGEITHSELLKFKIGRFLLPLSPMNTYYYAPVNTSATLPILITNHEFFPLNMDGILITGSYGSDLKVTYDVFAGGYRNTTWLPTGAVGFFGVEVPYYQNEIGSPYTISPSYNGSYNLAYGGKLQFD